jgi:hypothetical protein
MFIIRETFFAKPGMASKMAKMFTESMPLKDAYPWKVMTDVVSDFNQVVLETKVNDLSAYEKRMKEYQMQSNKPNEMKNYTEMYMKGRREIFRVWD